jgi:hypothetical protein
MNRSRLRQILAVARFETARGLFTFRALPLYLLAGLPVGVVLLLLAVFTTFGPPTEMSALSGATIFFAHLYQFILRFVAYAGCVWIFMNLFRGEVLDRSLHYYFLTPLRREVLVVGKFVAGWTCATLLFCGATALSMTLLYGYYGPREAIDLLLGPSAPQLWGYLGATALACIGYGAVFLVIGLFLRNPIVPALLIWVLEWANPFLPSLLKKLSVIFYVKSLLPVTINEGPFALIAQPAPAWIAVPGLLVFAAATLTAATLRIRRMEIAYGAD